MGTRGRKPTPTMLRLITGRHLTDRPVRKNEPMPEGKPRKPAWLLGRSAQLWHEVLGFAFWLTVADSYKLAAWCAAESDFENPRKRSKWTASDRREHRAAGSELGLDP